MSFYLGTKRKYGEIIAKVLKNYKGNTCYDVFGGSGSLCCQLSSFFDKIVYNEKNIFISNFLKIAFDKFDNNQFDEWWQNEVLQYFITDKESYFSIRTSFNSKENDFEKQCIQYFWLNNTCTSSLVRWNKNKVPNNPWYFNQAYCGKTVNAEKIKETLLQGFNCIKDKNFKINCLDYEDLQFDDGALLFVDPPYDNTYSCYLPETWDSERFVKWVQEKSKEHNICLFGTTKTDDFSDTKNLKPFFDLGWKVLVLSEKSFKNVSPHGNNENSQDRTNQRDIMLYNF